MLMKRGRREGGRFWRFMSGVGVCLDFVDGGGGGWSTVEVLDWGRF